MSAKSIVQSVFGKKNRKSAKSIVQDAIDKSEVGKVETKGNGDDPKLPIQQNGDSKMIEFTFSLDPEMVAMFGKAMAKGAKPDDRPDNLVPGEGESSYQKDPHEDAGNDGDDQDERPDSETEMTSDREFDQDDPIPPNKKVSNAEDEAIAMDNRHSNTPIENCRAEDPMFCPYHGAQKMTEMIVAELTNSMGVDPKTKGISVEVIKNGSDFTARATFPANTSLNDEQIIENGIWKFITGTKGIKFQQGQRPTSGQNQIIQNRFTDGQFSTASLKERMPHGFTDADYDVAKAKQDFGLMSEWLNDLIEDFGDPNTDIDPADLEELMHEHEDLEGVLNQLSTTGGNAGLASQFKAMKNQFEERYHDVRGIADLPQVKSIQDAQQMRDDIAGERHKAGDWWNAKEEIADLRKQLGLTTAGGRAIPMKSVMKNYPSLFPGWDKFKTKYENLFMGSLNKILGNGRTDTGANGKFEDAVQKGDLRKAKGALHTLKYATEEYADLMPAYMKAMQDHKNDLLQYAQQKGVTIVPYVPKQAPSPQQNGQGQTITPGSSTTSQGQQSSQTSTTNVAPAATSSPSIQSIQNALQGVPTGVVNSVFKNQNGSHIIECNTGNTTYLQSLVPSLKKKFPNSFISFIPSTQSVNGMDLIQID